MILTEHQRVACALRAVHAVRCRHLSSDPLIMLAMPKPRLRADRVIETMAVVTGDEHLHYNPSWTASISDADLMTVLAHELEHWLHERGLR